MVTKNIMPITVETIVNKTISKTWEFWTNPSDILQWNFASPDWHCPFAENDLKVSGKFKYTMAAKDDSMSFDFEGSYTHVVKESIIEYVLGDGRKVKITFESLGDKTKIVETFDPESENTIELQRNGWQAILNNFKKHTETQV